MVSSWNSQCSVFVCVCVLAREGRRIRELGYMGLFLQTTPWNRTPLIIGSDHYSRFKASASTHNIQLGWHWSFMKLDDNQLHSLGLWYGSAKALKKTHFHPAFRTSVWRLYSRSILQHLAIRWKFSDQIWNNKHQQLSFYNLIYGNECLIFSSCKWDFQLTKKKKEKKKIWGLAERSTLVYCVLSAHTEINYEYLNSISHLR